MEQVAIHGIGLLGGGLHVDLVLGAVGDHFGAAGEFVAVGLDAPRGDDLEIGGEGGGGQLEADLVVAFAGGAVGDGAGPFLQGDLDHALGDQRARDGRAEEVLAFIDGVGTHHRENEVLGELGLEVVDVDLARAGRQRLFLQALELLRLADVGRERDDLGFVVFLEPLQNDRGVQAARICQYDFHPD